MRFVTEVVREETYMFTPDDGSPEVIIMSGRLRKWLRHFCKDQIIGLTFPVETLEELTARHGLEEDRLKSMTLLEASDPVIVGIWPGSSHILIDGAHRRAFWAMRGVSTIKGWAVPKPVWEMFLFDPNNLPGLVQHHQDGSLLPQRSKK